MSDSLIRNLRDLASCAHADLSVADEAADEIERLREEIKAARDTIFLLRRSTLTSAELRLVDKNCDWEPFRHAFNAVMNHRLSCANKNAVFALGEKE